jgi:hypothetical protein
MKSKQFQKENSMDDDHKSRTALDILVWIVVLCLIVMGVGHYAWHARVR